MTLPATISSAAYDAGNRLTSWAGVNLAYDNNGNLLSDGSLMYTWDSRNRLSALSGTATASFTYDAVGRRSSRAIGAVTTGFLYDGSNVVQELSGGTANANPLKGTVDELFSRTDTTFGTRYFVTDAQRSALALLDSGGTVQASYAYEPYGATTSTGESNGNIAQYAGRENDGTGLYYYRARYYRPGFMRFTSADPAGFTGGVNAYAYVNGNPISYTDPLWFVG